MSGTVHLVVGSTGAGKSTYSLSLAAEEGAVRFAVDEWMRQLYFPERPPDAGADWYMPRVERATEQIWQVARQIAALGGGVVLEIGLTQRAPRQAFLEKVEGEGLRARLHVVEAPVEVRWERVRRRNAERGETFAMEVTRGMFDFVESMWEPPDEAELERFGGRRVPTGSAVG